MLTSFDGVVLQNLRNNARNPSEPLKMTRKLRLTFAAAAAALLVAGCASNDSFLESQKALQPAGWTSPMPELEQATAEDNKSWWHAWKNPELEALLAAADAHNTDILTALANLRSAAALAGEATAELFPTLSISGQGAGNRANNRWTESWNVGADAAWSISLAGGNIAAQLAADHEALAQAMTLEDTRIAVAAEVAQTYVSLRLAYVQKSIAEMTLANYSQAADIARWNYEAGLSDKTEVDQAVSNEENARARVPQIEQSIISYRNALARLTGQAAGTLKVREDDTVPTAPMNLAVSVPAQTLKNRPDMRAAEYSLIAASERVYEARSQWFPTLNLTGSLGTQVATISALGASGTGVGALIAALSMPLINWGEQVSASEQRLAALDSARASYTKTLLAALEETENALTGITTSQRRAASLERALRAAISAADLAMSSYSAGLTDYQQVLTTQITLFDVRESVQSNKADLATQLIALYRALGGGWKPSADDAQAQQQSSDTNTNVNGNDDV